MHYLINHILSRLSARTPFHLLDGDRWRIENNFYGPYVLTGSLASPSLVIGARSGLLALEVALGHPGQRVFVVERDSRLREALAESARNIGVENLRMYDSLEVCLEQLRSQGRRLGHVRIDLPYFSQKLLADLSRDFSIEYLMGEFDESLANPLWIHRMSRNLAQRFHWQNATLKLPMPGRAFSGPDVSVVIPAYGVEKYLDHCMESLLAQTLTNIEYIIVDDGARDRSGEIADEWARRDERVRVIHQTNAGCAAARSNGLRAATGYFFGLVDGDDWVDEPMYQSLAESAVRYGSDIAQCGYRRCFDIDQSRADEPERFVLAHQLGEGAGLIANPRQLVTQRPAIWRRIYRRDFLTSHGIDFPASIKRFDDLPFHFMTLALADRVSVVSPCYYNYRQQRPGQDIMIDDERLNVHFPIFSLLKDFVRQYHSPELEGLLFMTQVASHEWTTSVIRPGLLEQYQSAVKYDLFADTITMSPADMVRVVKRQAPQYVSWLRSIQRRQGTGETDWQGVRDFAR